MRRSAFLAGLLLFLACDDQGPEPAESSTVATMSLRPTAATIQIGQRLTLIPTLLDAGGVPLTDRPVTWTSSNPDVATVASGLVTGVDDGESVITAAADGRSATARVTVQLAVSQVVITPESPVIAVGTSVQLMATPLGPDGTPLDDRLAQWISLNTRVAIVNVGKVRGLRVGTAEIVATVDDQSATTTVLVLPNISGRWTLTTSVGDPIRSITCTASGPLTVVQSGGVFEGVHERVGTCETPGGPVPHSGDLVIQDAALSPARLDFLLLGDVTCFLVGVLTGTPASAAAGEVSCAGAVAGEPAALSGQWEMRR